MTGYDLGIKVGIRGGSGSLDLSAFDCDATITRVLHGSPDTASVTIRNIDAPAAGELKARSTIQVVAAGVQLFLGDIKDVTAIHDGGTITYQVTVADGGQNYSRAMVSGSYPPGQTVGAVIRAISASVSIPVAYISPQIADTVLQSPWSVGGRYRHVLDRLVRGRGRWTIQHGALVILADMDIRGSVPALVVDDSTAIQGGISVSGQKITVTTKLEPGLVPGFGLDIRLTSLRVRGRVSSVTHQVASQGRQWATQISAKVM